MTHPCPYCATPTCPYCSHAMVQQLNQRGTNWFCRRCWLDMPQQVQPTQPH